MTRPGRARLGRGLGALLGEDYLQSTNPDAKVRTVPLRRIVPNPLQPRREFGREELQDLARSIQENGLLQPLVVRPDPGPDQDRYQLVAGERRFRAVSDLGWTEVAVVVREVDDRTLLVLAMVENLQRESLTPLEEAEGFQQLAEEFGLTQGEIATAVGKNRVTVSNTLRLLKLPLSVRRFLQQGDLTMGHARALLAIEDSGRLAELARRTVKEGWSVREVEARTRVGGRTSRQKKSLRSSSGRDGDDANPVAHALEEALRDALGTRVRLRDGGNGRGVIEVPFRSVEDFERVFELLTGTDPSDVVG